MDNNSDILFAFILFSPDDHVPKNNKAKAFHYLLKGRPEADLPPSAEIFTVYDGSSCFHAMMVSYFHHHEFIPVQQN